MVDRATHPAKFQLALALLMTAMLSGRAMTLAFLWEVGASTPGAPPVAWLMPLVGDAVIGLAALPVTFLLWKGRGLGAWTAIVVWNVLGIWDALAALMVHLTTPWPDFFMVQIFGSSMFFAATAMHAGLLLLVVGPLRIRLLGDGSAVTLRPRYEADGLT